MLERYAAKIARYAPVVLENPLVLVEALPVVAAAAVIAYVAENVMDSMENA